MTRISVVQSDPVSEYASERIAAPALARMRQAIEEADGQEVLFVGHTDSGGIVVDVEVAARGSSGMVAVPLELCERGDVILHNHPSANLRASDADVSVAARLAETGIGSAIVDNEVSRIYVLVEPSAPHERVPLNSDEVSATLDDRGAMARALEGFVPRESQLAMVRMVADGFNESRLVVAEAGTGVGKSFAYLIPAVLWAAANDERVVVATATIALQQQILDRDLPTVQRALGTSLSTALVKGRGNYLCLRKVEEERREAELFDEPDDVALIADWAATTTTGSRTELPFHARDEVWSRVASDADTCNAARCHNRDRCFILRARREAAQARVLVANHHMVFGDLSIRRAGAGWDGTALLPPFRHLIFDEAHNLERAATSFFSEQVSSYGVTRVMRRLVRTRGAHRFGLIDRLAGLGAPGERLSAAERSMAMLNDAFARLESSTLAFLADENSWRLTAAAAATFRDDLGAPLAEAHSSLVRLAEALAAVAREIDEDEREQPDFFQLVASIRRLESMAATLDRFRAPAVDDEMILWLDRRRARVGGDRVRWVATPLDIRDLMRESVFDPHETVVMTSATLSVHGSFDYWGGRLGLRPSDGEVLAAELPSPFDYPGRVLLGIASDAPAPDSGLFRSYLATLIERLVGAAEGGALILFTSYAQLDALWEATSERIQRRGFTCFRQGSDDRARLLDNFRADRHSVLFATDSFWEGVDAPGDTLRLVIVCRLPFRVPTEPVQLARAEALERGGGSSFGELSLPQAIMRLKQGFGRLMRRVDDYGAVVIADSRIATKSYGRLMVESLPPARVIATHSEEIVEEVGRFLAVMADSRD